MCICNEEFSLIWSKKNVFWVLYIIAKAIKNKSPTTREEADEFSKGGGLHRGKDTLGAPSARQLPLRGSQLDPWRITSQFTPEQRSPRVLVQLTSLLGGGTGIVGAVLYAQVGQTAEVAFTRSEGVFQ